MRAFLALLGSAAVLAGAAGCSGGGKDTTAPTNLSAGGFKDRVAAAITLSGDGLNGAPGFGVHVDVTKDGSLDTLTVRLGKPYAEYVSHPERQETIVAAVVKGATQTMKVGNAERTFAEARPNILPLLKPATAFRRLDPGLVTTSFAGGLRVVYGVQLEDSFTTVTTGDLARWHRRPGEIESIALANLDRETKSKQKLLCEQGNGQEECGWASGDGYDASRMLVPDLRRKIVRQIGPAVYAVPRESVFVALPIKLAPRIRDLVTRQFVTAPNPVSRDLFVERGGKLIVLRQ